VSEIIIPKCSQCGLSFFSEELLSKHINETGHREIKETIIEQKDSL
jgi:hypothetical protein